MEAKARVLLAKADSLDGMAGELLTRAICSKLNRREAIAEVHCGSAQKLQRRAAALRKLAANLAAEYFEIQPIAEPIGREAVAV